MIAGGGTTGPGTGAKDTWCRYISLTAFGEWSIGSAENWRQKKGSGMKKLLVAGATVAVAVGLISGTSTANHGSSHDPCENPTIKGGKGADTLIGTPRADVIKGRHGPDTIRGRGGNDTICGNKGADRIFGGRGNDRLFGGHANDRLIGGKGTDRANGKSGTQDYCRAEFKKKCER